MTLITIGVIIASIAIILSIALAIYVLKSQKTTTAPASGPANAALELAKAEAEKAKAEAEKAKAEAEKAKAEAETIALNTADALAKANAAVEAAEKAAADAKAMLDEDAHAKRLAKNAPLIAAAEAELAIAETELAKAREERHFLVGANDGANDVVTEANNKLADARTAKCAAISRYGTAFAAKAAAEKASFFATQEGKGVEDAEKKLEAAKAEEADARMALQAAYAAVKVAEAKLAEATDALKAVDDTACEKDRQIEDFEKKVASLKARIEELEA
jgi:colicin import membrane protein